jgi:hypothetical protein
MHNPSFPIYATVVPLCCASKFIGIYWNLSCMILGTNIINTRTKSLSSCSANRYGKSRVVSCHSRELEELNVLPHTATIRSTGGAVVQCSWLRPCLSREKC